MKICLILLIFFVGGKVDGQVSGRLITADSLPVSFANISLLSGLDSSFVKAAITNDNGVYAIDGMPAGKYLLRISTVGYRSWHSAVFTITAAQYKIDIGTYVMREEKAQLQEVVVRAGKPLFQQKPEGLVVNVESSLLSKGSSALQVLERSPGVVINHRDNSIALNGKNGVMVMLNGKLIRMPMEQLVNMLNGMSADDIASIELLTTPPAKYDAEGSAGIINIVLKKNRKMGTNGNMSVTGGYGKAEKATASVNLSHNTKRVNLYGSYTFSHDRSYTGMYVASSQDMPFLGGLVDVTGWFNSKMKRNNHDVNLGADVKLNPKITAGGGITYNRSGLSGATYTNAGYNVLPDSLLLFNGFNQGYNNWNNIISSVYLEKNIRTDEKVGFYADYLYFKNDGNSAAQSTFTNKHGMQAGDNQLLFSPGQRGFANTGIGVGVAKIDYSKQLDKKIKLETGLKGAYTQSKSLSGVLSFLNGAWVTTEQTSNSIRMKEAIGAAYASLTAQLTATVNFTAGLRYEYSYTNMDNSNTGENIVSRRLGSFFPSLFISKKINDKAELQLSYTKRISRPAYNDLASYVGYSDPTAVYTGNPFLKPTITNNIKLGYNYKSWSFSLLFSRDDNAIARYQLTESPAHDILYISPQNLSWQNNITFQTALPFAINSWWSMNYGFAGGPRQYKVPYTKNPFQKTWFGYSLNVSQAFKLPNSFSAEVSGYYNSTSFNGSQKVAGFGVLNAGIKKELKNNAGSFQLSVSDILGGQRYLINYGTVTQEAFSIRSYVEVNTESSMFPIIKLTYSRSFGNVIKELKRQAAGSQDERNRVMN